MKKPSTQVVTRTISKHSNMDRILSYTGVRPVGYPLEPLIIERALRTTVHSPVRGELLGIRSAIQVFMERSDNPISEWKFSEVL